MSLQTYRFTSEWTIEANPERVRSVLFDVQGWPTWWKGFQQVKMLKQDVYVFTVGYLVYRINFTATLTYPKQNTLIIQTKSGDLHGQGTITVEPLGTNTSVTILWNVEDRRWWAQVHWLRPFFIWAHDKAMQWGKEGLTGTLNE